MRLCALTALRSPTSRMHRTHSQLLESSEYAITRSESGISLRLAPEWGQHKNEKSAQPGLVMDVAAPLVMPAAAQRTQKRSLPSWGHGSPQ